MYSRDQHTCIAEKIRAPGDAGSGSRTGKSKKNSISSHADWLFARSRRNGKFFCTALHVTTARGATWHECEVPDLRNMRCVVPAAEVRSGAGIIIVVRWMKLGDLQCCLLLPDRAGFEKSSACGVGLIGEFTGGFLVLGSAALEDWVAVE